MRSSAPTWLAGGGRGRGRNNGTLHFGSSQTGAHQSKGVRHFGLRTIYPIVHAEKIAPPPPSKASGLFGFRNSWQAGEAIWSSPRPALCDWSDNRLKKTAQWIGIGWHVRGLSRIAVLGNLDDEDRHHLTAA